MAAPRKRKRPLQTDLSFPITNLTGAVTLLSGPEIFVCVCLHSAVNQGFFSSGGITLPQIL